MRMQIRQKARLTAMVMVPAMVLGLAIAAPLAAAPVSSTGTATAIMQASTAVQSGDCAGAIAPLNQLWHDPYLEQNDPALAAQFRFQLIACTLQTRGLAEALALSTENVTRAYDINAYDVHIFLQVLNGQPDAAAASLDAALTKFPDQAPGLTDISVIGVLLQFYETNPARTFALLGRLEETHWQIHNVSGRPLIGLLRLEGLRAAVRAGDTLHADLYRAGLKTDSLFYVISQGDGTVSAADVPSEPIGPVITREIDDIKKVITGNPADLLALSYLMNLEQMNDQNSLALTQLNGILALVDQYGLQNFGAQELYPELLTTRAELYANVGRYGDAGKAYEEGATKLGAGKANGLIISYMNFLIDREQERACLALISRVNLGSLEDMDKMTLVVNDACAQGYLGDKVTFARDMALLQSSPLSQIKPYLCAGESDNAARALIASMSDPASRDSAIAFLQLGLPAIAFGDRDELLVTASEALKQRPDVQAAAKANHIIMRKWNIRLN